MRLTSALLVVGAVGLAWFAHALRIGWQERSYDASTLTIWFGTTWTVWTCAGAAWGAGLVAISRGACLRLRDGVSWNRRLLVCVPLGVLIWLHVLLLAYGPQWRIDASSGTLVCATLDARLGAYERVVAARSEGALLIRLDTVERLTDRLDYGLVIRPEDVPARSQWEVVSRGDRTYVLHGTWCWAVVRRSGDGYSIAGTATDVSPFVLLGPRAVGRNDDLLPILERVTTLRQKDNPLLYTQIGIARRELDLDVIGIPTEHALMEGLESGNSWVRQAVVQIAAAAGRSAYPRLAQ